MKTYEQNYFDNFFKSNANSEKLLNEINKKTTVFELQNSVTEILRGKK